MEPDDIPVHDLLGVGDEAAPGPDPLRAIVARAGRRRLRMAAGGMALALAAGGVVGYAVSNHSSSPAQTATAPATGATTVAPSPGPNTANPSSGASSSISSGASQALLFPYGGAHLTRLFTRTAGPVAIRGYLISLSVPRGALGNCQISGPTFQAEVSTADMVGVVTNGYGLKTTSGVTTVDAQLLGVAEGDPTEVVTVATGAGVASVHMAFAGGGTDEMTPVKGWAALSAPVTGAAASQTAPYGGRVGELTAFNAAGHQVASVAVTNGFSMSGAGGAVGSATGQAGVLQPAVECSPPACPPTPAASRPPTVKGAPVPAVEPGSTVISPGAPTVSTGGAVSGGSAYACPLHPVPVPGASGGSAGSGATGSGSASSGTASSGAATSSNG